MYKMTDNTKTTYIFEIYKLIDFFELFYDR